MVMYRPIPRQPVPQLQQSRPSRKFWLGIAILVGLVLLFNLALLLVYGDKTYPRTSVAGRPLGNVAYEAAPEKLRKMPLLPETLQVDFGKGVTPVKVSDLGITVDYKTLQTTLRQRHWLPMVGLFSSKVTTLELDVDQAKLDAQIAAWGQAVASEPVDARLEQHRGEFKLINQQNGKQLDTAIARKALLAAVRSGEKSVTIKPVQKEPAITDAKLASQTKSLLAAQSLALSYTYGDKKQSASPADVVSWYRKDGESFSPSIPEIKGYLASLAAGWQVKFSNMDGAVAATRQALDAGQPLDFRLQGSPYAAPRTLTYCTAVRGVDTVHLAELNRKLAVVFADERGWSLGGLVRYVHATGDCNFTVWLSAANQMPTFGAICDPEWSCNVSPDVVINFDRWNGASAAWNAAGGNLNDYGSMVINHESGHWHGYDHVSCPGSGLPAPVMQQQSINLQGCTFNAWPTAAEQAALRAQFGI